MTTMRARWAAVLGGIAMALSPACVAQDAAALRSRHAALGEALARSVFPRPLVLESWHTDGASRGEVSAVVAHPFVPLRELLVQPAAWCDALMLHQNVKGCRSSDAPHDARVTVSIGRKVDQPPVDAYRVDFRFAVADSHAD
ncbi:hypothetical protein [Azohydromonas sediminis]|uniref:hypothetical protein n=1 Tax=Azohydromonas sediminis TaxID=2259674 RepID=UPI0013C2D146|nr:hypothetical protein [Azohydromonas sediminis]